MHLALPLLLLASSCSCGREKLPDQVYGHFIPIPDTSWQRGEEYFFAVLVEEPSEEYRVMGVMRTNPHYKLNSIGVGVLRESPSRQFDRQVIQVPTKKEDQLPYGGYNLWMREFLVEEGKVFDEKGVYTYSFQQLMTDEEIHGVVEIGLIIERK